MTEFYSVNWNQPQHIDNSSGDFEGYGEMAVDSSSKLIGHVIGQVDVWLARSNTSVSGTVYVSIYKGTDDSIAYQWSVDASTIPQVSEFPSNPVTFGPVTDNTYKIASGDKILVEFPFGSSSNYVRIGENSNAPYDSGTHSYAIYFKGGSYGHLTPPRDLAANFWDVVGGAAPPSPPPPAPPPPPPSVGYVTNTANDIAAIMWSIGTGTAPPPPPPPPPVGTPPGPAPQNIIPFYFVFNAITSGRFLSSTGSAGSSTAYIRVGETAASSKSQLIGKIVKEVDVSMEKHGAPKGTLSVTLRKGSDDSIAFTFGTQDVTAMPNKYVTYQFVGLGNTYAMQKNDKILVEYNDPSSDKNNYISVDENNNDPYDGQNTASVYYTVSKVYNISSSKDMCMTLYKNIF